MSEETIKATLLEEPTAPSEDVQDETPAVITAENESAALNATAAIVEQENKPLEEGSDQSENCAKIAEKPTIIEKEVETKKRSLEDVDKNADPLAKKAKTEDVTVTEKKVDVEV